MPSNCPPPIAGGAIGCLVGIMFLLTPWIPCNWVGIGGALFGGCCGGTCLCGLCHEPSLEAVDASMRQCSNSCVACYCGESMPDNHDNVVQPRDLHVAEIPLQPMRYGMDQEGYQVLQDAPSQDSKVETKNPSVTAVSLFKPKSLHQQYLDAGLAEEKIPGWLLDPVEGTIMEKPVLLDTGYSVEKETYNSIMKAQKKCPIMRTDIKSAQNNVQLQIAIKAWVEQQIKESILKRGPISRRRSF